MNRFLRTRALLAPLVFAVGLVAETDPSQWLVNGPLTEAEARVGRPATPISAAGVARRTTRRIIRRTTIYIAVLPPACSTVVVNDVTLYFCGGVYYQPYGSQYVVVTID